MRHQEGTQSGQSLLPETRAQPPGARATRGNGTSPAIGRVIVHVNGEIIQESVPENDHFLIGRSRMCDLRLMPHEVSRHHALIIHSSNGINLVDLWSKNGTFVDGQLISNYPLRDYDAISIGGCMIRFIADDE